MRKLFVFLFALMCISFSSCATTMDMETSIDFVEESMASSLETEMAENQNEVENYLIQEELKVQDVEETVIYVERPVYVPEDTSNPALEKKNLNGKDAVADSLKKAVQTPEQYKQGTFFYQYDENFVYEIYAQPYHLTDIILEPGEVVIGTPLLSEDESVWELTAGVAKDVETGADIQHLFVKPAYSKLDSTLIIITDRRVYNFRLKSFADTHMAMVKFTYPKTKNVWAKKFDETNGRTVESEFINITNPEFLSFDYQIKYSIFKKPEFLPTRVYDDGKSTYIQLDEIVLQKKLPVAFNEKNEIVNYSVKKNVIIIPRLINKVTLRLGNEKVTVIKKKTVIENKTEVADE